MVWDGPVWSLSDSRCGTGVGTSQVGQPVHDFLQILKPGVGMAAERRVRVVMAGQFHRGLD